MGRLSKAWWVSALLLAFAVAPSGITLAGEGREGETGGPAPASPTMEVQRDKDKTVYSIGGSARNKGKSDTDRSWEMLNNGNMLIDGRGAHGKRPDNNR